MTGYDHWMAFCMCIQGHVHKLKLVYDLRNIVVAYRISGSIRAAEIMYIFKLFFFKFVYIV